MGIASEDGLAAGCVFRNSLRLIRAADLNGADVGVVHVNLIVGDDAAALERLGKAFGFEKLTDEGDADDTRAGLGLHANFDSGVSRYLHVAFPFGIAREAWFAVAGVTGGGGSALGCAADGEAL